jgi:hypothetical protein
LRLKVLHYSVPFKLKVRTVSYDEAPLSFIIRSFSYSVSSRMLELNTEAGIALIVLLLKYTRIGLSLSVTNLKWQIGVGPCEK